MNHTARQRRLPPLQVVAEVGSTNAQLVRAAWQNPDDWPHMSGLLARRQNKGRGRSGRTWTTGADALTFSLVLRPARPRPEWGWVSLLAGAAVVHALTAQPGARAVEPGTRADPEGVCIGVKWPNDVVHLGGDTELQGWGRTRKMAGILTEALADGAGVVLGIGMNLRSAELPVPWAGAADEVGLTTEPLDLAYRIQAAVADLLQQWTQGQDPRAVVAPLCLTLGEHVRVTLPAGGEVLGQAVGLARDGALRVRTSDGAEHLVRAGDVGHVRAGAR